MLMYQISAIYIPHEICTWSAGYEEMDDATAQLENNRSETGYLVSGKDGVIFAVNKMVELPSRAAVIQPLTQFVLHSLSII